MSKYNGKDNPFNTGKKAYLLLADGKTFEGFSFGREGTIIGEIVFTTAMTGYQETLSDASYYGQIVTQTFPLIGNYGVNEEDFESDKCHLSGYIVREWCNMPSNFRSEGDINELLKKSGVVGIHSIDTRSLTRIIREAGVMNGAITTENINDETVKNNLLKQITEYKIKAAVKAVSGNKIERFTTENAKFNVVLYDYGYKFSIRSQLLERGCNVIVVPSDTSAEDVVLLNPDGIMLSNGPGDPSENVEIIENLRKLMEYKIPTFGVCLGHQLIALANGAKTEKLKYGHRGANQPVIDILMDRTFITSQNHGYTVVADSINPDIGEISFKNANDGTCEGVKYKNVPTFTAQFYPEAQGGPLDTTYLFDDFLRLMENKGGK